MKNRVIILLYNIFKLLEVKMGMPNDLILVRHGLSEANQLQQADRNGDGKLHDLIGTSVSDREWRLDPIGVIQAQVTGQWIKDNIGVPERFMVSPFIRTRETAAHLNLSENAVWEENRSLRERSWGEIDSLRRSVFAELYPLNAGLKERDPMYWAPPGGESIANVAENRVRNVLNNISRNSDGKKTLLVTHGEFMLATTVLVEELSDEEFLRREENESYKIHNCCVIHYSRTNPYTGEKTKRLSMVRRAWPYFDQKLNTWLMHVGEWHEFSRHRLTNKELLEKVSKIPHRLPNVN